MQISFANLEKISNVMAERDWQDSYQPVHTELSSYDPCINLTDNSLDATY